MSTREEDPNSDLTTDTAPGTASTQRLEPDEGRVHSAEGASTATGGAAAGAWGGPGGDAARKKAEKKEKRKLQGWTSGADLGLLFLRLVLGAVLIGHGSQKLFGAWGGPGIDGFAAGLEQMGYSQTQLLAVATGVSEFAGGILIVLGLLVPIATAAVMGVMASAIVVTHFPNFFVANGGMELALLVGGGALALAFTGPGRMAADNGRPWFRFAMGQGWVSVIIAAAATVLVQLLLHS